MVIRGNWRLESEIVSVRGKPLTRLPTHIGGKRYVNELSRYPILGICVLSP